jgi:putative ABC transport system permease protein
MPTNSPNEIQTAGHTVPSDSGLRPGPYPPERKRRKTPAHTGLIFQDLLKVALRQVLRNQRRYRGVFLSITLGIAGLVTVLSMGEAIEKKVAVNLELLGSATIIKASWDFDRKSRWHHGKFRPGDLQEVKKLKRVVEATGFVRKADQTFIHRQTKIQGQLMGVESNFFSAVHIAFSEGSAITEEYVFAREQVCVVGSQLRNELFQGSDSALGKKIFVEGKVFTVIGILGGVEDREYSRTLFIPISVAWDTYFGEPTISGIHVRAMNWQQVFDLRGEVFAVLAKKHGGFAESLEVTYYPEKIKTITAIEYLVKFLLYLGLALVIILGGSGITNLMYLAVQERSIEIGLRKAVGATEEDILTQFLVEAVATSFTGVAVGLAFGITLILVLRLSFDMIPDYSMMVAGAIGALMLGICLGVISGLAPARKASRFDPVEAMRFE